MATALALRWLDGCIRAHLREVDHRVSGLRLRAARRLPRTMAALSWLVEQRLALLLLLAAVQAIVDYGRQEPIYDAYLFANAGARLLGGHFDVFADPKVQAGPLQLLVNGSLKDLAHLFHSSFALAFALAIYLSMTGATVLIVRRLFRDQGLPLSPSLEIYAGLMVIFGGLAGMPYSAGQGAEGWIPLILVLAAREASRSRAARAGLLLGLAAGFKLWALAAAPLLLLDPNIKKASRGFVVMVGSTGALYGPFLLFTPVKTFTFEWSVGGFSLMRYLFGAGAPFTWQMRVLQGALIGAGGALIAIFMRKTQSAVWAVPLAIVGLRLLTDPILFEYYWVPVGFAALAGSCLLATRALPALRIPAAGALFLLLYPAFLDGGIFFSAWVIVAAAAVGYFSKQTKV